MRKKSWLVNALSFVLALIITVSSLVSPNSIPEGTIKVEADTSAKSRVQTFIGLAAGKQGAGLPDLGQLTQDELQFLGVYLSNFYVPFSTELGLTVQSEQLDAQKELMVQALNSNLNFNEVICGEIVDTIMGLSRSNCKELKYGFVSTPSNTPSGGLFSCTYWDFINLMFGNFDSSSRGYGGSLSDWLYKTRLSVRKKEGMSRPWRNIINGNVFNDYGKDYVVFGFQDNEGNFVKVCDARLYDRHSDLIFDPSTGDILANTFRFTPSQIAFFQCLLSVDTNKGYGLNFFDVYSDDIGTNGRKVLDELYALCTSSECLLSEDDIFNLSAYGNKVYVDCFGNLFRSSNAHQTVILPGCMNPYTWVQVKPDGSDADIAGSRYMTVNVQALSLIDSGNFATSSDATVSSSPYVNVLFRNVYKELQSRLFNERGNEGFYTRSEWNTYVASSNGSYVYYEDDRGNTVILRDLVSTTSSCKFGYKWNTMAGDTTKKWDVSTGCLFWTSTTDGAKLMHIVHKKAKEVGFCGRWLAWDDEAYTHSGWSSYDGEKYIISGTLPACADRFYENYTGCLINMCFIDNLGAFGFDSSNSNIAYESFVVDKVISDSGAIADNFNFLSGISGSITGCSFNNIFSDTKRGAINTINLNTQAMVCLYTTYAIAGLYKDDSKRDTIGRLGYRMNREGLPKISNAPLTFSESYADDLMKKDIQNMIYYALKPDGVEYIKVMIKNKLQAILVDWHNDMVGTNGIGYNTGTTYYRTNYGYVTTPDLSELQWTASLLDLYDSFIPLLVIFMIVCMLISFITGVMSLQRAVLGALIFSAFLLVPTNAINFVVEKSNGFTSNIYGEKFIYWAVVQEETFGNAIDSAASGDSYENYIRTLYSTNAANQGGESIVVKWQAPKKMASLMLSSKDKSLLDSLKGSLLTGRLLNNAMSGEAYLDGASQYLYRDYSDLANFSRYIYRSLESSTRLTSLCSVTNFDDTWRRIHGLDGRDAYNEYKNAGYTNNNNFLTMPLNSMYSPVYFDATSSDILDKVRAGRIDQDTYLGINQDMFNVSIAYFNNTLCKDEDGSDVPFTFDRAIRDNASSGNLTGVETVDDWLGRYVYPDSGAIRESVWNSLMVYGLMSESPFYYYSWIMYDDDMSASSNASGGYRSMLLSDGEGKYFYNMDGNGELKDYMNMRSMFYYVIPFLKRGNDIVRAWDERYGIFVYDGVPTDEGYLYDHTIQNDATLKYKYWHNLNVARLYEIYTPWVDLMYDCRYANPCYVKVMGEKYWIEDPLDPWSYPDERPMIFSESEMLDYGLSEADLTEVERRILKFNRESQKDMFELLNYYNFSDLSLNTAAAMQCTFNFNRVFSETGLFSSNINLYPQAFEIKDFSYDAFLRFILSTTTGESLSSSTDFYGDLVKKSSTTTALLLLICDILSQYVVPFAKIVFLMAIFLSSILLIMVSVFRVDPEFKFVVKLCKDIFIPLAEFFAVTIAFAYVISLFMGTGNNAVTQTANVSISLGDPNMVLVAMCVLNVVCIVLYVKLLLNIWECIKTSASLIKSHVTGLTGGVVAMGVAGAKGVAGAFKGNSSGGGSYNEAGTGTESARATARSIKHKDDVAEKADMGKTESDRMAETRRRTISNEDGKSDEKRSGVINSIINSGKNKRNSDKGNETGKEKEGKSDSPEKKDDK